MNYQLLANLLVVLHLAFVAFIVLGGLLVYRWRWVAWLHVPSAIWGALLEFAGWTCPLTPLENALRGKDAYSGGFVEHYLLRILYPTGLPPGAPVVLGLLVIGVNALVYGKLVLRLARRPPPPPHTSRPSTPSPR